MNGTCCRLWSIFPHLVMSISTCAPCGRLWSQQGRRGPGNVHQELLLLLLQQQKDQSNVFKLENWGWEGIPLCLCVFKTNSNHTDAIMLTVEGSSGLCNDFNNNNFIQKADLKAQRAWKRPLYPFVPRLCFLFCRNKQCDGLGCPICQNLTVRVSRSNTQENWWWCRWWRQRKERSPSKQGNVSRSRMNFFKQVLLPKINIHPYKSIIIVVVFDNGSGIKPIFYISLLWFLLFRDTGSIKIQAL